MFRSSYVYAVLSFSWMAYVNYKPVITHFAPDLYENFLNNMADSAMF